MKVTKSMSLITTPQNIDDNADSKKDEHSNKMEAFFKSLSDVFANFQISHDNASSETLSVLSKAADYAIDSLKEKPCEEYLITSLHQLLFLEISQMIKTDTKIKRFKLCGRYFIATNMNMLFCSNAKEGEEKPRNVIGSKRVYDNRVEDDESLRLYNRAYRTRHARFPTVGKNKKNEDYHKLRDDFDSWCVKAKEMRDKVRAGELDISDFKKWLSQGIRGRKKRNMS
jgi:hypothetical protein